ncbi:ShlB/FhaC/HecB family hemolysin secretion/activation protein [Neisseria animalis]|uniref:ShlB/FhaC/HecB family hemolysin secretion/activation protein n=2 Tax=Neisseria animalis TaxID=492 RepID=A0A5P3MUB4_NEIAN|nr:ShlB/FhaC/HecB family hemolysin secretion/activation protein [Neisseria animalis]ROW32516.1 ShlB/FhaC/HecB family hemolysin secretion/activation protein [Neisseria animalis]
MLLVLSAWPALLFAVDVPQASRIRQDQLRQQELQQQIRPRRDVHLERPSAISPESFSLSDSESHCFPVQSVTLIGDSAETFQFALKKSLKQSGFQPGMCIGAQGINRIMTLVQNAVIGRGYTTTRILAAPQDLNSGILELTVLPGRIRSLHIDRNHDEAAHAGRIAAFQNEFPLKNGDILNLRDLEQGLENLKRLPTVEADIRIEPGAKPSESDVKVVWQQRLLPYRITLSADDSGSKATGKYQGSAVFSADNPLGLSDMFYASVSRDLGHKASYTDADGKHRGSSTAGYAFHYSVPFGKWLWSWNHNYYRYHQAVAGVSEVYDYNGKSRTSDIGVSRLLYRDAKRKTHLHAKLWQRETQSFIDDTEIEVQRRKTAGWSAGINHKEYIGKATLDLSANYKRGTGRNNSLSAPEEVFGEGTSRMKIITADVAFNMPFQVGKQQFAYDTRFHVQWNKTPLTPLDKLSIGNRYTVRGFDGETTLSAERGRYWRNDVSWQYAQNHRAYIGIDTGRVSGHSAQYLPGQRLTGGAVGFKGQFNSGGNLYYDVFAAKPLHKPAYFQTADTNYGFNLNYSF